MKFIKLSMLKSEMILKRILIFDLNQHRVGHHVLHLRKDFEACISFIWELLINLGIYSKKVAVVLVVPPIFSSVT